MTDLYRLKVTWSGFSGGPATSAFHFNSIPTPASVKTFFTSIKNYFPSVVQWSIAGSGDTFDDATGDITGSWSGGGDLSEAGSVATAPYVAPAGILVRWTTASVIASHHLQGRLFLVPCVSAVFDQTGTPQEAVRSTIATAASALTSAASGHHVVWARPVEARAATAKLKARAARAGSFGLVTGAQVPDKAVVLRSRRD
jgi:hypothetical protein